MFNKIKTVTIAHHKVQVTEIKFFLMRLSLNTFFSKHDQPAKVNSLSLVKGYFKAYLLD
jgi:hypothetical protein